MTNLSKLKRDRIISYLNELKKVHNDDKSIAALNEIEITLKEKKFGLVFEKHEEQIDELLKENIPVFVEDKSRILITDESLPINPIIEGDNLQALYLLEKTHRGKVDCIYIDPPYNNRNKSWKYNNDYVDDNDTYKHSKWLSLMERRLLIAKRLLNPSDSVLIVTIDEKEFLHLGCLLEDMFPSAKIQMISSVINHGTIARNNEFNRNNEYIFFVMIGDYKIEALEESKNFDEGDVVNWRTLRRTNAKNTRESTKNQFYAIYVDNSTKKIVKIGDPLPLEFDIKNIEEIAGCTPVFPIRDDGTEMMWGMVPEELANRLSKGYVKVCGYYPEKPQKYSLQYLASGTISDIESGKITVNGYNPDGSIDAVYSERRKVMPKTQWDYPTHDARDYGTYMIKKIFLSQSFDFPKSLYAVHDTLRLFLANKPNAVVVDFFAGSGTTLHAVNLLNAEDGGHRVCIMATNNEMSLQEEKMLSERGLKPGDEEWEAHGVARHITYPRSYLSIVGKDIKGKPIDGQYKLFNGEEREMSLGFKSNIKYYKCEWTDRRPNEYLLSNALCLHIKEMLEIQNFIEIDGNENILILNKQDFNDSRSKLHEAKNVWVNQNIIFSADELVLLKQCKYRSIPKEFFGEELKEAGE